MHREADSVSSKAATEVPEEGRACVQGPQQCNSAIRSGLGSLGYCSSLTRLSCFYKTSFC